MNFQLYTLENAERDLKKNTPKSRFDKDIDAIISPKDQEEFNKIMSAINKYKKIKLVVRSSIRLIISISSKITFLDIQHTGIFALNSKNAINLKAIIMPNRNNKILGIFNFANFTNLSILELTSTNLSKLPSIPTLEYLYADNSQIDSIETQKLMKIAYLNYSTIHTLCDQPTLTELQIHHSTLKVLPKLPKLQTLVCNDTDIEVLPECPLIFLMALDTPISIIPESICHTIKYLFTEERVYFLDKKSLLEYYCNKLKICFYDYSTNVYHCLKDNNEIIWHEMQLLLD